MTATDELVNKWFIERWTAGTWSKSGPRYNERQHGPNLGDICSVGRDYAEDEY